MGRLRDRMVSDLRLRNYSPKTAQAYTWCMFHFLKHFYLIRGKEMSLLQSGHQAWGRMSKPLER